MLAASVYAGAMSQQGHAWWFACKCFQRAHLQMFVTAQINNILPEWIHSILDIDTDLTLLIYPLMNVIIIIQFPCMYAKYQAYGSC